MNNINANSTIFSDCTLCPRQCHINRNTTTGYCHSSSKLKVARAALHMWEEPIISGDNGSGAIFFSGCTLRCVFCQNHSIAACDVGKEISTDRLVEIFFELKAKGANNINLVTPTHFVPEITYALTSALNRGLNLPIVYNTSGYESLDTLKMLDGLIDIYLPDFKYMSDDIAKKYSNVNNYREVTSKALEEMVRQTGDYVIGSDGLMRKGVIVRHLLLPGYTSDSRAVIKYLYDTYGDNIFISIMNQYTPLDHVSAYPEINRKVTDAEYDEVVNYAISLGVENGFIQEGDTASESFIPDFNNEGV